MVKTCYGTSRAGFESRNKGGDVTSTTCTTLPRYLACKKKNGSGLGFRVRDRRIRTRVRDRGSGLEFGCRC
jgi:hypothetical protein